MIVAPSLAAAIRSPRFAGGRYSAGRIFSAADCSRLGPRKTMIFCIVRPLPPPLRVHRKDFEPRNNYPDDRNTDLLTGEVDHDNPVESLFSQCFDDEPDIGEEIIAVTGCDPVIVFDPVIPEPVRIYPLCTVIPHLFAEFGDGSILSCTVDLGQAALGNLRERTHHGNPCAG